ncbi:MAG: serine/threonine-protein kinase [Planctomycetota bacterium]|nr:serine/threonine-protein kinase [Planctomycetota bacterium]
MTLAVLLADLPVESPLSEGLGGAWLASGVAGVLIAGFLLWRRSRRAPGTGDRLGPYTLEAKIGEGGMGEVYRGHHALLRRPTAIKTLRLEVSDEEAIQRFEQEVQLTGQLRHPNTVAVYDYGRAPGNRFYYAMEYLTGAPIDAIVGKTGAFGEGRTIHVLRQLCGSLSEAHSIRLIHRDVKPSNLILCVRGGVYDWLKVVDFGLVKDVGNDLDALSHASGHISGTPLYMAPEALIPQFRHDGRQDIYAIGAVGYFLLTGENVFDGPDPVSIMRSHIKDVPEPPSVRAGRPIAGDLEALILRCLAKKPEDRPSTAAALARELEGCAAAGAWRPADAQGWWILNEAQLDLPEPLQHAEATSGFFLKS